MQNFWAVLVVLPIFTWYSMFSVLDRNYTIVQQDVENIVYEYTQIAGKKGMLYPSVFEEMDSRLSKYGEHEIYISAEKYFGGAAPAKLEGFAAVGADLRAQGYDLINITVLYTKRHPVSVMYEFNVFGVPVGENHNFTLFGNASSYIR